MFRAFQTRRVVKCSLYLMGLFVFSTFLYIYKSNHETDILLDLVSFSRLLFEHVIFLFLLVPVMMTPFLSPMFFVRFNKGELKEFIYSNILKSSFIYTGGMMASYVLLEWVLKGIFPFWFSIAYAVSILLLFSFLYYEVLIWCYLMSNQYGYSLFIFPGICFVGRALIQLAYATHQLTFLTFIENHLLMLLIVLNLVMFVSINRLVSKKEIL